MWVWSDEIQWLFNCFSCNVLCSRSQASVDPCSVLSIRWNVLLFLGFNYSHHSSIYRGYHFRYCCRLFENLFEKITGAFTERVHSCLFRICVHCWQFNKLENGIFMQTIKHLVSVLTMKMSKRMKNFSFKPQMIINAVLHIVRGDLNVSIQSFHSVDLCPDRLCNSPMEYRSTQWWTIAANSALVSFRPIT